MPSFLEQYTELAEDLDFGSFDVTKWEASFLNTVLEQFSEGREPTERQRAVLDNMRKKYIDCD